MKDQSQQAPQPGQRIGYGNPTGGTSTASPSSNAYDPVTNPRGLVTDPGTQPGGDRSSFGAPGPNAINNPSGNSNTGSYDPVLNPGGTRPDPTPMPKAPVTASTTQPTSSPDAAPYMSSFMQNYLQSSGAPIPTASAASPTAPASQFQSPTSFGPLSPSPQNFGAPQPFGQSIAPSAPQGAGAAPGPNGNEWGSVVNKLDLSGMPALGTEAQDAAYKNASGYLDPQWANQQHALETQLANQGVVQNSEAWNKAMDDFGRQKEFAYSQARNSAFNQGLTAQNQSFGQTLAGAQLANSAQGQIAGQGLTARQLADQLQAAQLAANAQVSSASIGANASMGNVQAQLAAAERQNHFNNDLTLRNQGINELLLQQRNPIDTANLLNQGTGVTQPNFTTTPNSSVGGTDLTSLINQAYQGQLTGYNAQTGSANSSNSAWASILAAIICDRRLKTNVRQIGMHAAGFPLYSFDYLWGEPGIGPMADEVRQVLPHAVIDMGGFDAVNMALLEAA